MDADFWNLMLPEFFAFGLIVIHHHSQSIPKQSRKYVKYTLYVTSRDDTIRLLEELVTSLGQVVLNTEHVENKKFEYTSSTRKFLADKWWGDGGNTG